jgi:hypothetical protein
MLPDFRRSVVFLEGFQPRHFALVVREVCGRRWVWNVGGKIFERGELDETRASNSDLRNVRLATNHLSRGTATSLIFV